VKLTGCGSRSTGFYAQKAIYVFLVINDAFRENRSYPVYDDGKRSDPNI